MKKPFISLKSRSEKLTFLFAVALCATVSMLFFMPEAALPIFSDGTANVGVSGLFDLVKGLV